MPCSARAPARPRDVTAPETAAGPPVGEPAPQGVLRWMRTAAKLGARRDDAELLRAISAL